MDGGEPKGVRVLLSDAFGYYRRYPLLFLTLAAAVVIPWELVVVGVAALDTGESNAFWVVVGVLAGGVGWFVLGPLVSALHIHAVTRIRAGERPSLRVVAVEGIRVLPRVAFAAGLAGIGTFFGMLALVVPGVFLMVRWAVVAQAAAIERSGWIAPLRRSMQLTDDQFGHVLAFVLVVGAVTYLSWIGVELALEGRVSEAIVAIVATALLIGVLSFGALTTALLYFDLRVRLGPAAAAVPPPEERAPQQASWDPRVYTDENRPAGWFIVPEMPHRMKFWTGGEDPRWGGSTRAPRKVRDAWRAELPEH